MVKDSKLKEYEKYIVNFGGKSLSFSEYEYCNSTY